MDCQSIISSVPIPPVGTAVSDNKRTVTADKPMRVIGVRRVEPFKATLPYMSGN